MYFFTADPRDGYSGNNGACNSCCCEVIRMKPGETNLLKINYAMWTMPIGGYGLTTNTWFTTELITDFAPADTGNGAPLFGALLYNSVGVQDPIVGNLNTYVIDPEADPMTFDLLPLYGLLTGTVNLNRVTGDFTYTPNPGANSGTDYFYFKVTDSAGNTRIGRANLGKGIALNDIVVLDPVTIARGKKKIDTDMQTMSVPITLDATVPPGAIYRITVRQEAIDCDGNKYYHISCYDILATKC